MPNRKTLALELSALEEHRAKDLRPYFEALSGDPGDQPLAEMLGALLLDRILHLLRRGSRLDLVDESVELASFLESEAGERLRDARPELHASWCAFEDLLAEAADRSDRDAVDSILLSHRGRGHKVLEVLAERAEPVRRAEIWQALGEEVSDSLVSHLLRDLEEADLIVRFRPPKSKEVLVELGPVGRDVARREVLPAWVEYLCEQIARLTSAEDGPPSCEEIRQGLVKKGAPSELVARRLSDALAGLVPVSRDEAAEPPPEVKRMPKPDDRRLSRIGQYRNPAAAFWSPPPTASSNQAFI